MGKPLLIDIVNKCSGGGAEIAPPPPEGNPDKVGGIAH
jgi:hypothetical protein